MGTESQQRNDTNPATVDRIPAPPGRIAHIVSVFPALTETFVLYEMIAMEKLGMDLRIYSLQRNRYSVMHPEALAMMPRVKSHPYFSWGILRAHLHFLLRKPWGYLSALWVWLSTTWGSLRYFTGALVFFPKAVYFARHMEQEGITHVHAHFASHPAAVALVIRRLTGIPYSFIAHGSDIHRETRMLPEKVREAAFVVTVAEFNREWIMRACKGKYGEKIFVVPCGVDSSFFSSPSHERLQGPKPAILCIGTLIEVKGQKFLLEACAALRNRGIPSTCHLVGDGPDRAMLLKLAQRLGIEEDLRLHGYLPHDGVLELMRQADVLVCCSVVSRDRRREGLPTVLIEAMAAGVPVVASRLSGIPELVEHETTGLLFPPGDSPALAEALERLIRDPELGRSLASAAHQKVLEQYDRMKNCSRLAQLISDAAFANSGSNLRARGGQPCTLP
jgi:colanic acid/amylovoran biosynthesis glycosyltransferase